MTVSVVAIEPRYRQLVESLPNLVWTCRGDGPCDYLSPQWVAYTGRPEAEQLGYGWLDALHPDDRDLTFARWSTAVESKGTLDTEFRIRRHDGVYRWFATRAVPEIGPDGTIVRWFGTNTDIQERRDAEAALQGLQRELEERVVQRTRALSDARTQLDMAQRITHTGSWSFDLETTLVEWSDELFRILRLPVSEVCPQYHEQEVLFHPASWPRLAAAVSLAAEKGVPYQLELRLADSDEGPRHAMACCEPELNENGQVVRLTGTFQDVTELVRAREERDRATESARLATSFAGVGIWDWTVATGDVAWNDQMYRLFNRPTTDRSSYTLWQQSVHPEDLGAAETAVRKCLDEDAEFLVDYRTRPGVSPMRTLRAAGQAIRDDQGQPLRMIGVIWDVTSERQAADATKASISRLEAFIREAPAAIAMLDADLRYVVASARWRNEYHLAETPRPGQHHYAVFPETPESWRALHREVLTGAVHSRDADPFRRTDGTLQYIRWEARPWFTADDTIGGMLLFSQDVTEAVRLQNDLRVRSDELQRSNEDLQQFAYAASHDLQEPLRAVSGFARILGQQYAGRLDPMADEIIRHMTEGASRMQSLIDDLLSFSRAGSCETTFTAQPLAAVLGGAQRNVAQAIAESGAVIEVTDLPDVWGDRNLLVQLFQNLLGNSIKYAGAQSPRIEIAGQRTGTMVELRIRDHGIGIPASSRERVFQIFQRLHTREEYPGTGVGLALCRRIVERHGGTIWIASTDGPGCTVHLTLPSPPEAPRG